MNGGGVLESPADFDYAAFRIGQGFCQYADCDHCPVNSACNAHQESAVEGIDDVELRVAFLNQDARCFALVNIVACEVVCSINKGQTHAYYADEDDIRRHDSGFSVELKNGFECSLRLTDEGFLFSMGRCPGYSGQIQDIAVYPYIGLDEIVFVHQGEDIIILARVEIGKLDLEKQG